MTTKKMPPPPPAAPPNGSATKSGPPPAGPPPVASKPSRKLTPTRGQLQAAEKIAVYGPGGVGKTSLCSMLPDPLFIDLDEGSMALDVARLSDESGSSLINTWQELMDCLRDDELWAPFKTVVLDSATRAEELAIAHTLETVKTDRQAKAKSVEAYGFGKGYTFIYETFLRLFAEMDRHIRAGRNVCFVCHECESVVNNPMGEDWRRYEPRLQSMASGKNSIRLRLKEWVNHLLFIGYDVAVNEKGKASGSGTRTVYSAEMPSHWAKSRGNKLDEQIIYKEGEPTVWNGLFA